MSDTYLKDNGALLDRLDKLGFQTSHPHHTPTPDTVFFFPKNRAKSVRVDPWIELPKMPGYEIEITLVKSAVLSSLRTPLACITYHRRRAPAAPT